MHENAGKLSENRALHAVECTEILGITAFLNTLSNKNAVFSSIPMRAQCTKMLENTALHASHWPKLPVQNTKIMEIPVLLNTQCTKMLEKTFYTIDAQKCSSSCAAMHVMSLESRQRRAKRGRKGRGKPGGQNAPKKRCGVYEK